MDGTVSLPPSVGRRDGDNYIVEQSWRNQIGALLAVPLIVAALIYVRIRLPEFMNVPVTFGDVDVWFSALYLLPVFVVARAVFLVYNERFVITPEYVIHVTGRLAWRGRSSRLAYGSIQEIEIEETIPQRIFGVGDIKLIPIAGSEVSSVKLRGVRTPRAVKDLIRDLTKRSKSV
jgi:hypothetical protein